MIDGLKYEIIEFYSFWILERNFHHLQGVSKALNPNTNRAMLHVRCASFFDWIEVAVYHLIQVSRDSFGDSVESLIIEFLSLRVDKFRKCDRSQITYGNFLGAGIF